MSFKLSEEDEILLETVKSHAVAASTTDAIRIALREYAERRGLMPGVRRAVAATRAFEDDQRRSADEIRAAAKRELQELVDQASKP